MTDKNELNERGNHEGEFTQGVGGWAEYTVYMMEMGDKTRHDVVTPPGKVIPVIFLPGIMGSNLRMTKSRQDKLKRKDNQSWRPDDLCSVMGQAQVVTGTGYGGWFKNATPAQRQLNFDPNQTEVEYYHYTESKGRFDPEGPETLAADVRHHNVPDSLSAIPPLLGPRPSGKVARTHLTQANLRRRESPAQIARWRGWSEVLFDGAYGNMLRTAERYLNNMMMKGQLSGLWRPLLKDPREFGALSGTALNEADLKHVCASWYPVHAMGYNFLKSNGIAAKEIAARIRGLVKAYQSRGFKCDEVIIVTHSMGGLVARALLHPDYGNLINDPQVNVLGIYHNVMPSSGAAATYRRMRFGFLETPGFRAELAARVFGIDGENTTAVLANAQGPLELLPGSWYGTGWLKLLDATGKVIHSWPKDAVTAYESIYLQPEQAWWRLINPRWVNPGNASERKGGGIAKVFDRLGKAVDFIRSIESTFHPTSSYASYCDSVERKCHGDVVMKIEDQESSKAGGYQLPDPMKWTLIDEDGRGGLRVRAGARVLTLKLQPAAASGDETVPAQRSAMQVPPTRFVHGKTDDSSYEHQKSFSNRHVIDSMLYSIVQIAKTAKWGDV